MLLTKSNWFIIGPVATLLGFVMNGIYMFLDGVLSIQNIAVCIILFTIIVNVLLLPLTIKQQRSMKIQTVMNPELQALQKKYKNKKDQASMMKMQEEQQALYAKYGVSMMGSCLTLIIQIPILFAMYQVIWKIPAYITGVYNVYTDLVNKLMTTTGAQEFLQQFATQARISFDKVGFTNNTIVDVLYNFRPDNWSELAAKFPAISDVVNATATTTEHINSFLGINIADAPWAIIQKGTENGILPIVVAIAIPVLAGLTQYLSTKVMPQQEQQPNEENTMANSMKTMNTVMPLFSVFISFTLSAGLGIYWIANAVVRTIIQIIVNKKMEKIDIDEMIKQNVEKYNEKKKKQGLPPERISNQAKANLRNMKNPEVDDEEAMQAKKEKRLSDMKQATDYYNNTAKPGSLAAKARMVQQYNEKTMKKK